MPNSAWHSSTARLLKLGTGTVQKIKNAEMIAD
jgi:hypothetical protein